MGKLAGGGTADALEAVRRALAGVEQASRRRLSGPERLALVTAGLLVAGQLNALVSVLVAEAERARAAEESAGTPLTSWLTLDGRRSAKESAALVFTARDVVANEAVRDAALAGTVSVPQARSIARVLRELPASLTDDQRARAEADLLDRATRTPASGLARATASVLDAVSPADRESPEGQQARLEAQRHRAFLRRGLTVAADGDGSVLLRGSLPELQAAAFLRVLDAHVEASRRAARDAGGLHDPLASGVGTGVERLDRLHVPPSLAARRVDALMVLVETVMAARTAPSLAGDRPRVVVTMRESDLRRRAEQAGVLTTGAEVSAGDLRRLCCDAELVPAVLGSPSEPLDLGTAVRLVPPGLRAAVAL
ncbi:MAG: DUF222 domain-containing protein, partial [Nigerium sp.]|nr:DUF222 domain-containing protein [Nigerium sp.]